MYIVSQSGEKLSLRFRGFSGFDFGAFKHIIGRQCSNEVAKCK